jgi:ACS family glucarate transporter-like MFS transporter
VDIGGRHGGITGGFMNMASSLAALISSISAGWLVEVFSSFNLVFVVAASFNFLGALMWLRVDPTQSLSSPVDRT